MRLLLRMRIRRPCARPSRSTRYSGGAWLPRLHETGAKDRVSKVARRSVRRERWRALVHLYTCRPLGRHRAF